MLARWRPDVVFTTGGYVAIPVADGGGGAARPDR